MARTEKSDLAAALLDLPYGEMVALGTVLAEVIEQSVTGKPAGFEVADALHHWAKTENGNT